MRIRVLGILLALCVPAFFSSAVWAGSKGMGSVVEANNALIDNTTAMAGARLYACDVLDTDSYGYLRAQFGASQIVLATASEVVLDGGAGAARVVAVSGSFRFSAPSSGRLVIETPAGNLRGAPGQAFAGSISVTGPNELIVSATRGDLTMTSGGDVHAIPAGKSARISFDHSAYGFCRDQSNNSSAAGPHKIRFEILGPTTASGEAIAGGSSIDESSARPE